MEFLNYFISGLGLGSVYAIIALGYTMVYGIAKMLNFAHGDVIMVGAYIAFFSLTRFNLPLPAAILAAMLVCTVLGVVIERLAYKPLRQAPSLAVLITAIGVSYFLQNGAQILWSSSSKVFPSVISNGSLKLGGLSISYLTLITILTCIVIMVCLTMFINRTRTGSAMRACSEDKGASMLMGINVNQIISITFAIGSGLAAIASVLLAATYPSVYPTLGAMPGIKAFTAAV
ncbi:MAG: branched-chain amino acid ABC transporter permease, partial [Eubacteriales bacterium]|nr:branched-chain amino acid ABC transporter permease [Eubacteriales bacterium]